MNDRSSAMLVASLALALALGGSAEASESCAKGNGDPKRPGAVCREAAGPCDAAETCDGVSLTCPSDGFQPEGTVCDDGDACSVGDACDGGGSCAGGEALVCDDSLPCNGVETCDSASGCVAGIPPELCCESDADCADLCETGRSCEVATGQCLSGSPVDCEDGNPCTTDSCSAALGCVSENNAAPCDDGDGCTESDACGEGECRGALVAIDPMSIPSVVCNVEAALAGMNP